MDWSWIVSAVALVMAGAGWAAATRASREARQVTEMYWQLKYDHGELKTRVDAIAPRPGAEPRATPGTQFVPLTSVKR
jgi:hypothetical protein